jgi:hypothetical protein
MPASLRFLGCRIAKKKMKMRKMKKRLALILCLNSNSEVMIVGKQ